MGFFLKVLLLCWHDICGRWNLGSFFEDALAAVHPPGASSSTNLLGARIHFVDDICGWLLNVHFCLDIELPVLPTPAFENYPVSPAPNARVRLGHWARQNELRRN